MPGQTAYLGVSFEIDPGWHLYWDGQNDSGMPIQLEPTIPDGFTAQPVQWPAPVRHISPGGLLDHVYFDRVTLILPVKVPAGVKAGQSVAIKIKAKWLVCKELCLLEDATLERSFSIDDSGHVKPSPEAPLFDKARARIAKPLPVERKEHPITARIDSIRVSFSAPAAKSLTFYPAAGGVAIENPIENAIASGPTLTMPFEPAKQSDTAPEQGWVRGILEVRYPEGDPEFFEVALRPTTTAAGHH